MILSTLFAAGEIKAERRVDAILVGAAADLAPLERDLRETFHRTTGDKVTFVLASSGMLARQIEQGAPYDVYLSANETFVSNLEASGHILPGSARLYAYGRIALWSKDGGIRSVTDLLNSRVRHVAMPNPAHAPYGMAAREALKRQGLWDRVERRLVFAENVRQAFQFAQSGNADAVITAWTLVFDRGGILLPETWHAPIRQAGGVVSTSRRRAAARRFLDFLTGEQGRMLLGRYGLFPPKPSDGSGRKPPSGR